MILTTVIVLLMVAILSYLYWINTRPDTGNFKRSKHVIQCMLDLETFSLAPNAYIRSIGACFFDHTGPTTKFYISCDGPDQVDADVDTDTVAWWNQQTPAAIEALRNSRQTALREALLEFKQWVDEEVKFHEEDNPGMGVEVWMWGNGGDFDPVILGNAYKRYGIEQPWKWYNVRCFRTLKGIFREVKARPFEGDKHNALADAVNQAWHCSLIMKSIGRMR